MNCYLALIYARVEEKELAIPLIKRLLKTPGAVDSVDCSITVDDLKHRLGMGPDSQRSALPENSGKCRSGLIAKIISRK